MTDGMPPRGHAQLPDIHEAPLSYADTANSRFQTLSFPPFRSILEMRASLSAISLLSRLFGGEMSGLTAHFLFAARFRNGDVSNSLQWD
jgi:hypothetical protein